MKSFINTSINMFRSRAALASRVTMLEQKVCELIPKAVALDAVVNNMNYMAGMSELECNVRMVLDQHGIDHSDRKGYGDPHTND